MKKSFFGLCAMAMFALAMTSNSFDNTAFTANTVAEVVTPTMDADMSFDGRNSATISANGTSSSISGSGTISVTSAGGTGSGVITTTSSSSGGTTSGGTVTSSSSTSSTSSSSSSSSITTGGGSSICDYVTSSWLRSYFGCE